MAITKEQGEELLNLIEDFGVASRRFGRAPFDSGNIGDLDAAYGAVLHYVYALWTPNG